ncbi:LysR family transcriptional regulator [Variovorax dokdonensis]
MGRPELGCASQAAAKLGIAQSAMSRHMSVLRTLSGDELLVRVGNQMVPTERATASWTRRPPPPCPRRYHSAKACLCGRRRM